MNLHPHTAFNLAFRAAILRAAQGLPVRERHKFLKRRLEQLRAEQAQAPEPQGYKAASPLGCPFGGRAAPLVAVTRAGPGGSLSTMKD
jgi:hypothetical protein